jgi:hypothetical protein
MRTDERIDGVVVLIGSALSGEPSLHALSGRLVPCAEVFLALVGLPSRSVRSRCVAALTPASIERLHMRFQEEVTHVLFVDPEGIRDRCEPFMVLTQRSGLPFQW